MRGELVAINLKTAQLETHYVMDVRPYSKKLMKQLSEEDGEYEYLGKL